MAGVITIGKMSRNIFSSLSFLLVSQSFVLKEEEGRDHPLYIFSEDSGAEIIGLNGTYPPVSEVLCFLLPSFWSAPSPPGERPMTPHKMNTYKGISINPILGWLARGRVCGDVRALGWIQILLEVWMYLRGPRLFQLYQIATVVVKPHLRREAEVPLINVII